MGRLWNKVKKVKIGPSCSWECPHRRFLFGWRGLSPTRPPRPKHCLGWAARALLVLLRYLPQGRQPRTLCTCILVLHLHAPAQSWSESGLLSSGRIKTPSWNQRRNSVTSDSQLTKNWNRYLFLCFQTLKEMWLNQGRDHKLKIQSRLITSRLKQVKRSWLSLKETSGGTESHYMTTTGYIQGSLLP